MSKLMGFLARIIMTTEEKKKVSDSMLEWGDLFFTPLGYAIRYATPEQAMRIKEAFSEDWTRFWNYELPKKEK